jgi:dTDP-4-amino-4,6-dideoxygalactose transaminase
MSGPGSYWIGDEERREVLDVMESGYLSRYGQLGDPRFKRKVQQLEEEFARFSGAKHALALSSGTGSLWTSLLALGIGPSDEVLVPGYTFVATYSAVIFAGATPVLTEIDEGLTMDPQDLEARITERTKAIIPVHMLGNPCDMGPILEIARRHDLLVLEDCCQALGASYRGRRVGTHGHMGAFSLNFFKTITAGDGGLLVTDDPELYRRAFAIHDQGHSPARAGVEIGARTIMGMNLRINELTGAVALAQLRKVDRITSTLRAKKNRLKDLLERDGSYRFRTIHDPEGECGTILTVIFDDAARARRVAQRLGTKTVSESGWHVYSNMEHFIETMRKLGRPAAKGTLPRTDSLLERSMNISIGVVDPGLGSGFGIHINSTDAEIEEVAKKFNDALKE